MRRIALAVGVACSIALALDAMRVLLASVDVNSPFYAGYDAAERQRRTSYGVVYVAVGLLVIGIGVLVEALGA